MKLLSWNVNGVRAALGKGLLDWMQASKADVICLQEVKALPGDVQGVAWPKGYSVHWNAAQKKGYSGTALFSRQEPLAVTYGLGSPDHDAEGRAVTAEYADCYIVGVYVPNAQPELARIGFRQAWDRALLNYVRKLEKTKPVVFCGDLNVAHEEIDLARPKENVVIPDFPTKSVRVSAISSVRGSLIRSDNLKKAAATTVGGRIGRMPGPTTWVGALIIAWLQKRYSRD